MTYNVLADAYNDLKLGKYFHPIYRLDLIIKQIKMVAPSIITFQEAEILMFRGYVEDKLPEYEFHYAMNKNKIRRHNNTGGCFYTEVGVATAYHNNKFTYLASRMIDFSSLAHQYKEPKLSALQKMHCDTETCALVLSLRLQNRKVIHFANVHLKAGGEFYHTTRTFQVSEICKYIKSIRSSDEHVVLAGDFNTLYRSYLLRSLATGHLMRISAVPELPDSTEISMRMLKYQIYDDGDPMMRMKNAYENYPTNQISFTHFNQYEKRGDIIDYVFYCQMDNDIEVSEVLGFVPLPIMMPNNDHPSDHLPLAVKFLVRD